MKSLRCVNKYRGIDTFKKRYNRLYALYERDLNVYSDIDDRRSLSVIYSYVFDWCSDIAWDCVGENKVLSALPTVAEFSLSAEYIVYNVR
ncbi:MAG: hypothetical protein J07HQW2_02386 [Haloquadratum walsbyi J07HQW2]|jgi:hypothetical protein|uniref:Uncharacterized protein n=1 Tax=Haloquadratum walsbyi J07HQW2 TaxID=1238425 RepID=U1PU86_9EURY|nr:MAG: hypothetical protein J07HQW2_02386 [Haloquadratum walsbyi J07HQW2]